MLRVGERVSLSEMCTTLKKQLEIGHIEGGRKLIKWVRVSSVDVWIPRESINLS